MFEHHACISIDNISVSGNYAGSFNIVGVYQRFNGEVCEGTVIVGSGDHCSLFPIMTSDVFVSKSREQRAAEYARAKKWFRV